MRLTRSIAPAILSMICLASLTGTQAMAAITTPLTVHPTNRHYLINNGTPVVILGAGQPLPGKKGEDYRAYLDEMAVHKVNYGRVWHLLVWDSENAYFPWARDGGGTANDGLPKFNLTHWDSTFWSRLKDACAYAQSKNIYLNIIIFDECGIEAPTSSSDHRWDHHPFNPSNNVNGLSLPASGDCIPEFYSLTNSKLKSLQELYVQKMITETSGYPNVIYEICNEYTGPWDWEKYWIDYVSARCSNIVSVNRLSSAQSEYWTDSKVDMVKFHWGTLNCSTTNQNMVSYYSKNKPINYDETPEKSTITYTDYRKVLWGAFVGSGHIHLENGYNPGASYDAILHAVNFVQSNGVRFWEMAPNNGLVTGTPGGSAYTLANPGSEYVVYIVTSTSGGGSMNITLVPGKTYTAKAYNPSNGTYTNLTVNGNTISGIPSYSVDTVIYIKASGPPSSSTPNIGLTLSVDKASAVPGDALTYTLVYRNTGDGAASSVAISAPVPQYTAYVAGSASSGGAYDSATGTVKWSIATVPAGITGTLTFKVKVN